MIGWWGIETDWEGIEPNLEVPENGCDGLEIGLAYPYASREGPDIGWEGLNCPETGCPSLETGETGCSRLETGLDGTEPS